MGVKTKKQIVIDCFNNFDNEKPGAVCEMFYNCKPSKHLNTFKGVENALFPTSLTGTENLHFDMVGSGISHLRGLAFFKQYFPQNKKTQYRLLAYADDKKAYLTQLFYPVNKFSWLYNLEFDTPPISLAYKQDDLDTIILASDDKMTIWKTNHLPNVIENVPIITSMCMSNNILYCTLKDPAYKIWYTSELKAENIGIEDSRSKYISLEDELGYSRKIMTFNEEVYVFREYGISKITNYKGEISVKQIYYSNTMILPNTIAQCGNVIIFLTANGIYTFNGVKVSKTVVDISAYTPNKDHFDYAVASSLGTNYYLALKMYFDTEGFLCERTDYKNNAVLTINTEDFSYQIMRGVDVASFLPLKTPVVEKMLITYNGEHDNEIGEIVDSATIHGEYVPEYWRSKNLFSDQKTRLFTSLTICADIDADVQLIFDDEKTMSFMAYKSGVSKFNFKVIANNVKVEIWNRSNGALHVENVKLDYYEY